MQYQNDKAAHAHTKVGSQVMKVDRMTGDKLPERQEVEGQKEKREGEGGGRKCKRKTTDVCVIWM